MHDCRASSAHPDSRAIQHAIKCVLCTNLVWKGAHAYLMLQLTIFYDFECIEIQSFVLKLSCYYYYYEQVGNFCSFQRLTTKIRPAESWVRYA